MSEESQFPIHILNVHQRINMVRRIVGYVQKDKDVQKQYKAVTHDQVTAQIRKALIEAGIVIVPYLIESRVVDTGTVTSGGTPIIRYEATFKVDFVNSDDPKDRESIKIEAHANDQGDKAPGKALSYAVKYAQLKVFSLETGEDEEGRVEAADLSRPISKQQLDELAGLLKKTDTKPAEFVTYLNEQKGLQISQVAECPREYYAFAVAAANAKIRQQAKAKAKANES